MKLTKKQVLARLAVAIVAMMLFWFFVLAYGLIATLKLIAACVVVVVFFALLIFGLENW